MFRATVHILAFVSLTAKVHEFSPPIKLGRQEDFAHTVPLFRQKGRFGCILWATESYAIFAMKFGSGRPAL